LSAKAKADPIEKVILAAMANKKGTCVFIDCKSDSLFVSDSVMAATRFTPCSTFKIWNTLIGAECGLVSSSNKMFYKWDGETRFLPGWNKDLTLKEAFQASCVPAFQILARNIGSGNMKKWIDSISYGDMDISSGIDDFWLPQEGKKSIQISPIEQSQLIRKLINGDLPFSAQSCGILKEILIVGNTSTGQYFGKTGTGADMSGNPEQNLAWFVGYVISKEHKYSFACLLKGQNLTGKDSKTIIETILKNANLI
jgi:beta-lactamase class D